MLHNSGNLYSYLMSTICLVELPLSW